MFFKGKNLSNALLIMNLKKNESNFEKKLITYFKNFYIS